MQNSSNTDVRRYFVPWTGVNIYGCYEKLMSKSRVVCMFFVVICQSFTVQHWLVIYPVVVGMLWPLQSSNYIV